jgi:hypothetical protein
MMKKILLLLFLALIAFGCASKRYAKKAHELEKAGLYMDAADMYYKSAKANRDNVDAKIGLRKNGQLALDKKLSTFESDYSNRNVKEAVYSYNDALAYQKKVKAVGVELDMTARYAQYYKEVKGDYLDLKYKEAISALDREDFSSSLRLFNEIKTFDSDYKDVNEQILIARYEPVYRKAYDALNAGRFRTAYYDFDKVLRGASGHYKEADVLKAEAQEKAMITIAILPLDAPSLSMGQANNFSRKIVSKIKRLNSPFISFKDYNIARANSGSYIGNGIDIAAANAAGIKAVLVGKIVSYKEHKGRLYSTRNKGYIVKTRSHKDKDGKIHKEKYYIKDIYMVYSKTNSVEMGVEYQLISTEDGTLLAADSYNKENTDKIVFAEYKGSVKNLVPGYWKSISSKRKGDKVYDDSSSKRKLKALFRSRKQIHSVSNLSDELQNDIASSIAKSIINYNPE